MLYVRSGILQVQRRQQISTRKTTLPPTVSTLKTCRSTAISSNAMKIVSNKTKTWVGSRAELHAVNPTRSAS